MSTPTPQAAPHPPRAQSPGGGLLRRLWDRTEPLSAALVAGLCLLTIWPARQLFEDAGWWGSAIVLTVGLVAVAGLVVAYGIAEAERVDLWVTAILALLPIISGLATRPAVTPNRPEATCLILAQGLSPLGSGWLCAGSSPPSPLSDLAPMRFMAMFSVMCASGDSAPSDIPGVTKRLRIEVIDSTSSIGTGLPKGLMSRRSRMWIGGFARIVAENCFHTS